MKYILITVIVTLALTSPAIHAVEPEDPTVIFDTDFALPSIPIGDGLGTPVCIDDSSGLLVAGCDGAVGPEGPPGPDLNEEIVTELCALYQLMAQPLPSLCVDCGSGTLEPLEQCDDGNLVNGDGCSAECIIESCEVGVVNGTPCDEGAVSNGNLCDSSCQSGICEATNADPGTSCGIGLQCNGGGICQ